MKIIDKHIYIIILCLMFGSFATFEIIQKSTAKVLKVINASTIQADINNNGKIDIGETFCLNDVQTLTSDLNINQNYLIKSLGLNYEDGIKFGYLSDAFADKELSGKRVKIRQTGNKNPSCQYANIIVNGEQYKEKLIIYGFGITNNKHNENFKKQLEKAKKLNLVILNHRSNKYHKLDCEYGLVARDSIIIPLSQLSSDVSPCKFCHVEKSKPSVNLHWLNLQRRNFRE